MEAVQNALERLQKESSAYIHALDHAQRSREALDVVATELKRLELQEGVVVMDSGELDGIAKTSKEWAIRLEAALDMRLMDIRIEYAARDDEFRAADTEKEIAYVGYRTAMVSLEAQTALLLSKERR